MFTHPWSPPRSPYLHAGFRVQALFFILRTRHLQSQGRESLPFSGALVKKLVALGKLCPRKNLSVTLGFASHRPCDTTRTVINWGVFFSCSWSTCQRVLWLAKVESSWLMLCVTLSESVVLLEQR